MDKIYLVTAFLFDPDQNIDDPGVLHLYYSSFKGWFVTTELAEKAIIDNGDEIHEHAYTYCTIEESVPGIISDPTKEKWFKWESGRYLPIPKPKGIRVGNNLDASDRASKWIVYT